MLNSWFRTPADQPFHVKQMEPTRLFHVKQAQLPNNMLFHLSAAVLSY
jgi:hypothetical protein